MTNELDACDVRVLILLVLHQITHSLLAACVVLRHMIDRRGLMQDASLCDTAARGALTTSVGVEGTRTLNLATRNLPRIVE